MKNTRYCWCRFSYFASAEIAAYLEKQAQKGWMIQKPSGLFWKFRRIQPQNLTFSVTYFPQASDFDAELTPQQQQMIEFCQESGWQLAATWAQMQIFYTQQQNPRPIETDPVTQVETICRTMRRTTLPGYAYTLLLCSFFLGMLATQWRKEPVLFLSNYYQLIPALLYLVMAISTLCNAATTFFWMCKAKKQAQQGVFYQIKTIKGKTVLAVCFWSVLLLSFFILLLQETGLMLVPIAIVAIALLVGNLIKGLLKEKKASREFNLAVSVGVAGILSTVLLLGGGYFIIKSGWSQMHHRPVGQWTEEGWTRDVYADPIPLQIQELKPMPKVEWSTEAEKQKSTFLVSRSSYRQWALTTDAAVPDLAYEVVQVHVPWLYDVCEQGMLDQHTGSTGHFEPIEAASWGASKAWQSRTDRGSQGTYLLCYPNRLVVLSCELPMNDAQKHKIAEKLGKGEL